MTQYARPSSDVSVGGWSESAGASQTNIYTAIDEVVFSDADYIYSAAGSTDLCEIALGTITDPEVSSDHVLSYRYTRNVTNKDVTLVFTLFSSATQIATWTHANPSSDFTLAQQTLVSSDADAITDYSALSVQIGVSVNGGNPASGWVSFMQFTTPDAAGPVTINCTVGQHTFTGVSASVTPGAVSVTGAVGQQTFTGISATITNVTTVDANVGQTTFTGIAASVTPGATSVAINTGQHTFTGVAASVTPGAVTVTAGLGQQTFTGLSATVTAGASIISVSVGQTTFTGIAASVTPGAASVSAGVGASVWTSVAASVTPGAVTITAGTANIIHTGQAATVTAAAGATVTANTGTNVWTGVTASVVIVMTRAIVTLSDAAVYVVSVEDGSPL